MKHFTKIKQLDILQLSIRILIRNISWPLRDRADKCLLNVFEVKY